MRVTVCKVGRDWYTTCVEHGECISTGDWDDAYEAAMGHLCMWHPTERGAA